jgi:hypothetical protein
MSPEKQHEPHEDSRQLSAGDASRLLLFGLPRPRRPADEVIDRLGGANGARWLADAISSVTGIPAESWSESDGAVLSLQDLETAKERAKDAMTAAPDREGVATAAAAYFIAIAAAVSWHDAVITGQPRSQLLEPVAELAAVAPEPWAALLQQAAESLDDQRTPDEGG